MIEETLKKKEIMKKYNSTYKGYDKLYGEEQREKYTHIISEIGSLRDRVIVDIGCGTGLMEKLLKDSRHIIGLDLSIKMLKKAVNRFKRKTNYSWINADAENIPMRDGSIDIALMITVIQNIPNKDKTLREIVRILKDYGYAIITYPKSHYTLKEAIREIEKLNLEISRIKLTGSKDIIIKLKKTNVKEKAI